MQKHFLKFGKVFTNVACSPLILISNNSELAAKYIPNDVDQTKTTSEIQNFNNDLSILKMMNLMIPLLQKIELN